MKLVGGTGPNNGYLYATNPTTGTYGPVCDDYIDQNLNGVSKIIYKQFCNKTIVMFVGLNVSYSTVLVNVTCNNSNQVKRRNKIVFY